MALIHQQNCELPFLHYPHSDMVVTRNIQGFKVLIVVCEGTEPWPQVRQNVSDHRPRE